MSTGLEYIEYFLLEYYNKDYLVVASNILKT